MISGMEVSDAEFEAGIDAVEPAEEAPRYVMPRSIAHDLIVNPEVARALVEGTPIPELAQQLGVSPGQIRSAMNKMDMASLLKIESRRVIRHLSRRKLSGEKYLGLTTALAVILDKIERLENGVPPVPQGSINTTVIQNITVGLYGRERGAGSEGGGKLIEATPERGLPEPSEPPESSRQG